MPVVIVVNKVDRLKPGHIASQMRPASQLGDFHALHPVSAKTGTAWKGSGTSSLRCCRMALPTFRPISAPISRSRSSSRSSSAKAIQLTRDEVPHSVTAEVEEIEGKVVRVAIYVETDSQKQILVGKEARWCARSGRVLGRRSRRCSAGPVFLELVVKVRPKWRPRRLVSSGSVFRPRRNFGSLRPRTRDSRD